MSATCSLDGQRPPVIEDPSVALRVLWFGMNSPPRPGKPPFGLAHENGASDTNGTE